MIALRSVFLAGLVLLAVGVAGCGGSSGTSENAITTTATATASTTPNKRLSQKYWAAYQSGVADAKKSNQAAITQYKTCQKLLTGTSYESSQITACFDPPTEAVIASGQQFLTFIAEIGQNVGGACATATGNLHNEVKLYTSSVNHLYLTVNKGNVPEPGDVTSAIRTLAASQASGKQFEQACKPL